MAGSYRDYENGIADVLASMTEGDALVERNVYLPGRYSETRRQIDVLVRGRIFGLDDATIIVDCKNWEKPLDVNDVGCFVTMVSDVGADLGIIVSPLGASNAARNLAKNTGATKVRTMSLDELIGWRPRGIFSQEVQLHEDREEEFAKAARESGFRVARSSNQSHHPRENEILLDVFRHFGEYSPSSENQQAAMSKVEEIAVNLGVEIRRISHGIGISGGTPRHRWIDVQIAGYPWAKVMASDEAELEAELDRIAELFGLPRPLVTATPPDSWPVTGVFTLEDPPAP